MSNDPQGSGNTPGGGRVSDTPPSTWSRPAPRVGRIGDWNNTNNSSTSSRSGGSNRIATLASLSSAPPRVSVPSDDDDDDADSDAKEGESWFAGGERSGISVQNPNRSGVPGGRMVQDILRRAAETSAARASQASTPPAPLNTFRGGGHTLGSDEVESTYVPDQNVKDEEDVVQRNITFWRNGFSIEDGEFYSYTDPANERLLAEINTGRAPVSILNVQPGQPVEVIVSKRVNEDYVPQNRPTATFSGSGNRLGSPTPTFTSSAPMPGSFPVAGASSISSDAPSVERGSLTTRFEVDQTQPTTTVQIRLADGTRMPCRMNLIHTVGDIRNFINAARPENLARPYTIGTAFPNRTLEDDRQTIEGAGLANSVIIQRWV